MFTQRKQKQKQSTKKLGASITHSFKSGPLLASILGKSSLCFKCYFFFFFFLKNNANGLLGFKILHQKKTKRWWLFKGVLPIIKFCHHLEPPNRFSTLEGNNYIIF